MITPWQMYWLLKLDSINVLLVIVASSLFIIGTTFTVVGAFLRDEKRIYSWDTAENIEAKHATGRRLHRCVLRVICPVLVLILLMDCFLPTTKEMAAMLVIPRIANNEKVQDCGNRIYDLAVEWMDALKPQSKSDK